MNPRYCSLILLSLLLSSSSSHAEEPSLERMMLMHDIAPTTIMPTSASTKTLTIPKQNTQQPIRVLLDVRSNHSDGAHDFNTLIALAKKRHIDAMVFTEHDRFTIRFGLEPVPGIFKYSQEHPSLYQTGLARFFSDLTTAQQQSSLTLMAGTESTAGYTWQGIPFKNLSLHNAERHLITLGVTNQQQIEALPSYTLKHARGNKELALTFWFVFIFMLIFILLRKRKRGIALLLAGSFIAFMSTWLMKPTTNADEDFINTAHEQKLFVIWAHPGTLSGIREGPMGVQLDTPPYNKHIFDLPADAFAAVYGDTDQNTVPGGMWDMFMLGYMKGYIGKPMWAVAAGDYHEEGQASEFLGNFPMDVWAKSAQEKDILAALKHGKMVSWHMNQHQNISVQTLYLEYEDISSKQHKRMQVGDESVISADVDLVIGLKELGKATTPITLTGNWIVDGNIVATIALDTQATQTMATRLHLSKGRHVIRFQIPSQQGIRLETNPFLVQVRQ